MSFIIYLKELGIKLETGGSGIFNLDFEVSEYISRNIKGLGIKEKCNELNLILIKAKIELKSSIDSTKEFKNRIKQLVGNFEKGKIDLKTLKNEIIEITKFKMDFELLEQQKKITLKFLLDNYFNDNIKTREIKTQFCKKLIEKVHSELKLISRVITQSDIRLKETKLPLLSQTKIVLNLNSLLSVRIHGKKLYFIYNDMKLVDIVYFLTFITLKENKPIKQNKLINFIDKNAYKINSNKIYKVTNRVSSIKQTVSKVYNSFELKEDETCKIEYFVDLKSKMAKLNINTDDSNYFKLTKLVNQQI